MVFIDKSYFYLNYFSLKLILFRFLVLDQSDKPIRSVLKKTVDSVDQKPKQPLSGNFIYTN